jgi:hypothetical protein
MLSHVQVHFLEVPRRRANTPWLFQLGVSLQWSWMVDSLRRWGHPQDPLLRWDCSKRTRMGFKTLCAVGCRGYMGLELQTECTEVLHLSLPEWLRAKLPRISAPMASFDGRGWKYPLWPSHRSRRSWGKNRDWRMKNHRKPWHCLLIRTHRVTRHMARATQESIPWFCSSPVQMWSLH